MGEEWQRVTQKRKDGVEVKSESLPPRPEWPKVSRRAAQCVTPHLVNYITSYFWGVGAPALVARARFLLSFVPQRVRREQMDAFSFPTMSCWSAFISPTRPCWHFVLSLNFPCRNAACVCSCPAGKRLTFVRLRGEICWMSSSSLSSSVTLRWYLWLF